MPNFILTSSNKTLFPNDNVTYKAKWLPGSRLVINPNGGYLYIDGSTYISNTTEYYKPAGSTLSYSNIYHNSTTYSNGSYTTTYNSNGASSTPSSTYSTKYYTCTYNFTGWGLSGDCDNVLSTSNTASTYTFPDNPGNKCTMNAGWSSSCGSNFAYAFSLPSAPTKTNYRFMGWKSSVDNKIYNARASYTPTTNSTMTAQWEPAYYNVTMSANGGTFSNGTTSYTLPFRNTSTMQTIKKYSHTSNINDSGYKSSNYGNNWTNSNIRGTGRTSSSSQAHVVTIPGASSLTVELYYNGESTTYDWASVWAGSYPNYTASSNYSSTGAVTTSMGGLSSNKYGGSGYGTYTVNGYTLSSMNKKILTINGDTVTFGFRSDGSGVGQGYGYYAIVSAYVSTKTSVPDGTYLTPTRSGYRFIGWKSSANNQIYTNINSVNPSSNITLTAQWEEDNGSGSGGSGGGGEQTNKVCRRATTLHTDTCNYDPSITSEHCSRFFALGETFTYGYLGTRGTLSSGDAFDCDINGDGIYNPQTERFYYVSEYFDTKTKTFDDSYAVLIYYDDYVYNDRNLHYASVEDTNAIGTCDNNYGCNWYGPVSMAKKLPKTSVWPNVSLKTTTRAILAEDGNVHNSTRTSGGTLPTSFSYSGKAARLLTAQELMRGCNITQMLHSATNTIDRKCIYLFENNYGFTYNRYRNNLLYEDYSLALETPCYEDSDYHWIVYSDLIPSFGWVGHSKVNVRPVIEVPISNIEV